MKYTDVYNTLYKQAAKDDSDVILPGVAGAGTLLGSILYGRSRGASVAADKVKSLAGHRLYDWEPHINNKLEVTLDNRSKFKLPRDGNFADYLAGKGKYYYDGISRNDRIDKAIAKATNKSITKGGRIGLYAGIPLALLVASLTNSWRGDKQ